MCELRLAARGGGKGCRCPAWRRDIEDQLGIRYYLDPRDVSQFVLGALDRYPPFRGSGDVTVETAGNTVVLSSHVCTWSGHDTAVRAAWMAGGVAEVRDNIVATG